MLIRFVKDFWLALQCYYRGARMIYENWLWLFFFIPVVLTFVLYLGGEYILKDLQNIDLNETITHLKFPEKISKGFGIDAFDPNSVEMTTLINASKMLFVIISMKFSKYIVLIVLTPVLSMLSFRVENILTGNRYPFDKAQFIDDIYRGVNFSMRNMVLQMVTLVGWYAITMIIPPLQVLTTTIVYLVGSYYYGSAVMDFTNERRRMSLEQSVRFQWERKGFTLGVGLIFYGLFYISFIGIVFGPVLATVASTIGIDEMVNLKKNKHAIRQRRKKVSTKSTKTPQSKRANKPKGQVEDDWL